MRRLIAAGLLVVFVALATADTFTCPDGCESSGSPSAADRCNINGNCVFCTAGAVVPVPDVIVVRLRPLLAPPERPIVEPPLPPTRVPDRPPRHP